MAWDEQKPESDSSGDDSLPVFEVVCEDCKGRGHSPAGRFDECYRCRGSGYILTPIGRRVLDLMIHHGRRALQVDE